MVLAGPTTAVAQEEISEICSRAARYAAKATGVPAAVLHAISLTETGRKSGGSFRPWPWTVNMEGKGLWFENATRAKNYVAKEFNRGARSFDVGCFQLNYKWHGQAFSSVDEMFDPNANALYAAGFLAELFIEKGNWPDAAGAYHSRTPKYADKYRSRFNRMFSKLTNDEIVLAAANPAKTPTQTNKNTALSRRANRFPLLQGGPGSGGGLGSLFPAAAGSGGNRLIGGS